MPLFESIVAGDEEDNDLTILGIRQGSWNLPSEDFARMYGLGFAVLLE